MAEFYVFGSVCRGEPDRGSDVDILVVEDNAARRAQLPRHWSVYSRRRLRALYSRGTLFAWHLHLEAVQLWPQGSPGFLKRIDPPRKYTGAAREASGLLKIMQSACDELRRGTKSPVYEFGLLALAARDLAMAAAPSLDGRFNFSRHAPLQGDTAFPLSKRAFDYLLACRRASTRETDFTRNPKIEAQICRKLPALEAWATNLQRRLIDEELFTKDRS